ncbi:hypothetical protein C8R47DRAFT_1276765 [Mycena vitilis]|nr:hypothetical protein C8R47DRAFT_1276765 [Mycena vitilis]
MSLSPHTSFCVGAHTPSIPSGSATPKPRTRRSGSGSSSSSASSSECPDLPLPAPFPLALLAFPAPSLGSNAHLPTPKRGAPQPIELPPTFARPTQSEPRRRRPSLSMRVKSVLSTNSGSNGSKNKSTGTVPAPLRVHPARRYLALQLKSFRNAQSRLRLDSDSIVECAWPRHIDGLERLQRMGLHSSAVENAEDESCRQESALNSRLAESSTYGHRNPESAPIVDWIWLYEQFVQLQSGKVSHERDLSDTAAITVTCATFTEGDALTLRIKSCIASGQPIFLIFARILLLPSRPSCAWVKPFRFDHRLYQVVTIAYIVIPSDHKSARVSNVTNPPSPSPKPDGIDKVISGLIGVIKVITRISPMKNVSGLMKDLITS